MCKETPTCNQHMVTQDSLFRVQTTISASTVDLSLWEDVVTAAIMNSFLLLHTHTYMLTLRHSLLFVPFVPLTADGDSKSSRIILILTNWIRQLDYFFYLLLKTFYLLFIRGTAKHLLESIKKKTKETHLDLVWLVRLTDFKYWHNEAVWVIFRGQGCIIVSKAGK